MSAGRGENDGTGLLERDRELERIGSALTDAVAGSGNVVLIEGPAGIGKTTLAAAAADRARSLGMRGLRSGGRELERDFAFGVVRQLFDPVLRRAAPDDRERLLEGAGSALAALQLPSSRAEPEGSSEFGTLHGLYWLLANLSEEAPLLLIVDDAQWADIASTRFLAFVARRLIELPVLLLICARPDEWESEGMFAATASDFGSRPVVPAPLSRQACGVLVQRRFDGPVDEAFAGACHTATGGNPFLLSALLDELVSDQVAPRGANAEAVLSMGPRVVTRSAVARLGRLSADARAVAAAVAVLGEGTAVQELSALAECSLGEAREAVHELARVSILAHGASVQFAHPIIRNAVYGDLGPTERGRLHRLAARVLDAAGAEAERIAAQLVATDPGGDPRVCEILRDAAGPALAAGASHSAVAYLRRALVEPCPADDRADLLVQLGRAEQLVGEPGAIARLQEAMELTVADGRSVDIAGWLAYTLIYAGRMQEAVATAEAALTLLGDTDRERQRLLEATILFAGRQNLALASARRRVLAQLGDIEHEQGMGARQVQAQLLAERMATGASAQELAAETERLLADGLLLQADHLAAAFLVPMRLLIDADSELAIMWLDRCIERTRARGDVGVMAATLMFRCQSHLRRGELADAVSDGTDGLNGVEQWGSAGYIRPWCGGLLATAQVDAGDLDGAERTLARIAPPGGEVPDRSIGWDSYLLGRASLLSARGDLRGSLEATLQYAGRAEPDNPRWIGWGSRVALCLHALGEEPVRAASLVEEELTLARSWGAPGALGAALRARGLLLGDQAGEDSLREAASVLDGSVCKLEHARALVELGAMLRRAGRRRDARRPLSEGFELARICGAVPVAARAEDELRAAGASPRAPLRAGIEALTASERRVAQMAASGQSNKQIAQALFVTVKTVETHLHRTYQKLDVTSRAQLVQALDTTA